MMMSHDKSQGKDKAGQADKDYDAIRDNGNDDNDHDDEDGEDDDDDYHDDDDEDDTVMTWSQSRADKATNEAKNVLC